MANKLAVIADTPGDYRRLGLSPTTIAPWEDGKRTDDSAGTYEWWYFDAHLADGAKLVVSFMDKGDIADPKGPLSPVLRLNLHRAYGRQRKPTPTCASAIIGPAATPTPAGYKRPPRRFPSTSP